MATSPAAAQNATPAESQALYNEPLTEEQRGLAAGVIQRNYRGHRARREMNGLGLDPTTRWMEAIKEAQYRQLTKPHPRTSTLQAETPASIAATTSEAKQNWRRIGQIARRAGEDVPPDPDNSEFSSSLSDSTSRTKHLTPEEKEARYLRKFEARKERQKTAKMMDLQYFLEMVDLKHRYGSHLRAYHNYWKSANTNENFFYWLDHGEGKNIELPTCTREKLEKDQVRYLSREERLQYLVKVDEDGKLRWAKNRERIWTDSESYRDSVKGIVPIHDKTPMFGEKHDPETSEDEEGDSSEAGSEEADAYVNHDLKNENGLKKVRHVSPATIFNHLLRHPMKGNSHAWIFVADTSFRLYVGIKQSGTFQHSSFLHGSRISAAGLIKIKDGQLRSLSPLSGHYRPPASNFRAFVHSLKEEGVDMGRVSISKSYAVLVGIEGYQKGKKRVKEVGKVIVHEKDRMIHPKKVKKEEEEERDKSESAEKERQHLENVREEEVRRKRERERELAHRLKEGLRFRSHEGGPEDEGRGLVEEDPLIEGRGGPEDGIPAPEGER